MLDKETFKNAEGKLYGYFRDLNEISILKIECKDLEDELEYVERKICGNRKRIRQLKRNTARLKKVLTIPPMSKEMMDFTTYKYKLNKSVDWISNKMYGGVRSTAYRRCGEILEDVVKWTDVHAIAE
ncbi:hypothetical protein CLRAG_16360 [Clostridium ragsdalei P11]|uniref:Phage transcriptional regulator, RinA family n=1 Tax=Clostridium ragsdalei P11 TaxID=1353534 RepID=A0A1A6AW35_9CLOT|nr:transcriptional regulator [Clostridium ragsdalei]OBR94245.1 hypothetical protein CLRAG_16360 [Clostridium ragsdalei P11]